MKLIYQVAFWAIISFLIKQYFGWNGVLIEIAFILFMKIVDWDEINKKLKEEHEKFE